MKRVLAIFEQYLRKYPSPTSITLFPGLFKLTYTYSCPYTNSKNTKEVFYPLQPLAPNSTLNPQVPTLAWNEKGRIEQPNTYHSILVNNLHDKVFQDDVFGKARRNKQGNRWVYMAHVKPKPPKSYYQGGTGNPNYPHDLGETYDGVTEVGIFLWDKDAQKLWRVDVTKDLIPSFPSFANEEGSQIIFHAYKKQPFGFGLLHCFNRPVKVYKAELKVVVDGEKKDEKGEQERKLESNVTEFIDDKRETNIFPSLSPCYNYISYLSGTGITHTYYMDLAICKRVQGKWVETHRIPDKFVGYYDTVKTHTTIENGQPFVYLQTIEKSTHQIIKVSLETGEWLNLTQKFPDHDFAIKDVRESGFITGTVTTNNFTSFFYLNNNEITIVPPLGKENFQQKEYSQPIYGIYLYANSQDIYEEFRDRVDKRPLIVIPHGGPHGSFYQTLTLLRYTLLKMGYGILLPNFSGSVGQGQKFLANALGRIGEIDAQEIIALLKKVLEDNPSIDRNKVHVQGGSYGGYMSAIMGTRYPEYFKSATILNGVLNLIGNMYFSDIPEWTLTEALGRGDLSLVNEKEYEALWRQSPTRDTIKIPTLQFLGAKDRRVPFRQGLLFDAITKEAGVPINTYVYENSAHALDDSVDTSLDIALKTVLFLEKFNEVEEKTGEIAEQPKAKESVTDEK